MKRSGTVCAVVTFLLLTALLLPSGVFAGGHTGCDHQWELTKSVAATCTESGRNVYRCSLCGEKQTETIPALGHNWAYCQIVRKPTCTEDGLKRCVCSRNPDHVMEETLPATGHQWSAWVVLRRPVWTENGLKKRTCGKCGETASLRISRMVAVWSFSAGQSAAGFFPGGSADAARKRLPAQKAVPLPVKHYSRQKRMADSFFHDTLHPGCETAAGMI